MKRLQFNYLLFFTLTALFLWSCEKPIEPNIITNPTNGKSNQINVIGRVVDLNGQSVANAVVKIGKEKTVTDSKGSFYFRNTLVPADYAYITAEKDGFFLGSRTFTSQNGKTQYVYMKMLPKTIRGNFSSTAGGSVSFDGVTIEIPGGGVVTADGKAYTGNVRVAAQYINPEASDLSLIMPGDVITNTRELLKTYGMVAVELLDNNGNKLQLGNGKEATLTFPVAPSQSVGTPVDMPLWYFDESAGFWKREGSATLQGNTFVGKVKHFSFWNCDTPEAAITLDMTVVDPNGNPLPNMSVQLVSANYGQRNGVTNGAGYVGGLVPQGDPMVMTIYDNTLANNCIVHGPVNIGPFNVSTSLGNVVVNAANLISTTVTGVVTDCSGNPVSNGVVKLEVAGVPTQAVYTSATGGYSLSYVTCTAGVNGNLVATDLTNYLISQNTAVTLNGGVQNVNITTCGGSAIVEYIDINVGGTSFMFNNPNTITCMDSTANPNVLQVTAYQVVPPGTTAYINFTIDNSTNPPTIPNFFAYNPGPCPQGTFVVSSATVTNWPSVTGQYLDCTISGTFNCATGGSDPFTTTVHIKKD